MILFKKFFWILFICNTITQVIVGDYAEKKFVIVIPSYNNSNYYERNIKSVICQKYPFFRVVYTDDCSSDKTGDLVETFLKDNDKDGRVKLIKNQERRGALHNLYMMIHSCNDDEIIITLDGDDWLPDDEVLSRLNTVYSSSEIWLTYGQFKLYPSNTVGWACAMPDYIVKHNAFRDFQHLPTHLRTFYAWLFKQIKTEDFLYLGQFYPMTWDMVMMFPMIEMAGERHAFIPDIMYIYNEQNSISDHYVSRQLQAYLAQVVKKKKRYNRLDKKPDPQTVRKAYQADVVIFAYSPPTVAQLIDSLVHYVQEAGTIFVMYKPANEQEKEDYHAIRRMYPELDFCLIGEHRENFKDALYNFYQASQNDYILFLKDGIQFCRDISLSRCITLLREMQAYAFYFNLNAMQAATRYPYLSLVECRESIFAWNFSFARDKWSCANSLDGVLHKKTEDFATTLQGYYDLTPEGLEMVWGNEGNLDRLGLCFNKSYINSSK